MPETQAVDPTLVTKCHWVQKNHNRPRWESNLGRSFTSRNKPSLLDVILVNHASFIGKTFNFNCGLSDVHNLIGFQLNIDVPSNKSNWRKYRSFKNFDVESFNTELGSKLSQIDFSEGRNVNEMYEDFTHTITSVTDKFAPQKVKKMHT